MNKRLQEHQYDVFFERTAMITLSTNHPDVDFKEWEDLTDEQYDAALEAAGDEYIRTLEHSPGCPCYEKKGIA